MTGTTKAALSTTVAILLAGLWVFLSPFIIGYQEAGADWTDSTKNSLWTGGALISISTLTLLLYSIFGVREALKTAPREEEHEQG